MFKISNNLLKKYSVKAESTFEATIKLAAEDIGAEITKGEYTDQSAKIWLKEVDSDSRDLNIDLKSDLEEMGYSISVSKTGNVRIFDIKDESKLKVAANIGPQGEEMRIESLAAMSKKYVQAGGRNRGRYTPNWGKQKETGSSDIHKNLLNQKKKLEKANMELAKLLEKVKTSISDISEDIKDTAVTAATDPAKLKNIELSLKTLKSVRTGLEQFIQLLKTDEVLDDAENVKVSEHLAKDEDLKKAGEEIQRVDRYTSIYEQLKDLQTKYEKDEWVKDSAIEDEEKEEEKAA